MYNCLYVLLFTASVNYCNILKINDNRIRLLLSLASFCKNSSVLSSGRFFEFSKA